MIEDETQDATQRRNAKQQFDVVVIGSGPGGYATALRAAELGLSVAVVEKDSTLGGVCLNRGCIPSKALITATHAIATTRDAARMGIEGRIDHIDYSKLASYQNDAVTTMTNGLGSLFKTRAIKTFHGIAQLDDAHNVLVQTDDTNPSLHLHTHDVVLATGSRPRPLPDMPFGDGIINSDQALLLKPFPKKAVVIGAGAVAVEFASLWNEAGVDVTLLIRKDRVLSSWHRRTGSALTRALKHAGINVVTHSEVDEIIKDKTTQRITVGYTRADGDRHDIEADVALVAIGRDPATDFPWIKNIGIATDDEGHVVTDAYGRTDTDGLWAVGDITKGRALASRAFEQGIVIAETIAGRNPQPVDDTTVANIVFSSPEAASVGLTLEEAKADTDIVEPQETVYPMMGNARMHMSGSMGSMSVITGAHASGDRTKVVLGVHMVAPQACDLISEAEQLIGNHVPLSQAARLIHPHPTFSETLGEALLKADGRPLNTL